MFRKKTRLKKLHFFFDNDGKFSAKCTLKVIFSPKRVFHRKKYSFVWKNAIFLLRPAPKKVCPTQNRHSSFIRRFASKLMRWKITRSSRASCS